MKDDLKELKDDLLEAISLLNDTSYDLFVPVEDHIAVRRRKAIAHFINKMEEKYNKDLS